MQDPRQVQTGIAVEAAARLDLQAGGPYASTPACRQTHRATGPVIASAYSPMTWNRRHRGIESPQVAPPKGSRGTGKPPPRSISLGRQPPQSFARVGRSGPRPNAASSRLDPPIAALAADVGHQPTHVELRGIDHSTSRRRAAARSGSPACSAASQSGSKRRSPENLGRVRRARARAEACNLTSALDAKLARRVAYASSSSASESRVIRAPLRDGALDQFSILGRSVERDQRRDRPQPAAQPRARRRRMRHSRPLPR